MRALRWGIGYLLLVVLLFAGAFLVADPIYMRFLYRGDLQDFAPGDAFGVLLVGIVLFLSTLLPGTAIILAAYRTGKPKILDAGGLN